MRFYRRRGNNNNNNDGEVTLDNVNTIPTMESMEEGNAPSPPKFPKPKKPPKEKKLKSPRARKAHQQGDGAKEFYSILGVDADASDEQIRTAFKHKALSYHPDRNPTGADTFKQVNEAYHALQNEDTTEDASPTQEDNEAVNYGLFTGHKFFPSTTTQQSREGEQGGTGEESAQQTPHETAATVAPQHTDNHMTTISHGAQCDPDASEPFPGYVGGDQFGHAVDINDSMVVAKATSGTEEEGEGVGGVQPDAPTAAAHINPETNNRATTSNQHDSNERDLHEKAGEGGDKQQHDENGDKTTTSGGVVEEGWGSMSPIQSVSPTTSSSHTLPGVAASSNNKGGGRFMESLLPGRSKHNVNIVHNSKNNHTKNKTTTTSTPHTGTTTTTADHNTTTTASAIPELTTSVSRFSFRSRKRKKDKQPGGFIQQSTTKSIDTAMADLRKQQSSVEEAVRLQEKMQRLVSAMGDLTKQWRIAAYIEASTIISSDYPTISLKSEQQQQEVAEGEEEDEEPVDIMPTVPTTTPANSFRGRNLQPVAQKNSQFQSLSPVHQGYFRRRRSRGKSADSGEHRFTSLFGGEVTPPPPQCIQSHDNPSIPKNSTLHLVDLGLLDMLLNGLTDDEHIVVKCSLEILFTFLTHDALEKLLTAEKDSSGASHLEKTFVPEVFTLLSNIESIMKDGTAPQSEGDGSPPTQIVTIHQLCRDTIIKFVESHQDLVTKHVVEYPEHGELLGTGGQPNVTTLLSASLSENNNGTVNNSSRFPQPLVNPAQLCCDSPTEMSPRPLYNLPLTSPPLSNGNGVPTNQPPAAHKRKFSLRKTVLTNQKEGLPVLPSPGLP